MNEVFVNGAPLGMRKEPTIKLAEAVGRLAIESSKAAESVRGFLVPDAFTNLFQYMQYMFSKARPTRNDYRKLTHINGETERHLNITQGRVKFQLRPRKTGTYRYGGKR